jgi:hypothetical protein
MRNLAVPDVGTAGAGGTRVDERTTKNGKDVWWVNRGRPVRAFISLHLPWNELSREPDVSHSVVYTVSCVCE